MTNDETKIKKKNENSDLELSSLTLKCHHRSYMKSSRREEIKVDMDEEKIMQEIQRLDSILEIGVGNYWRFTGFADCAFPNCGFQVVIQCMKDVCGFRGRGSGVSYEGDGRGEGEIWRVGDSD